MQYIGMDALSKREKLSSGLSELQTLRLGIPPTKRKLKISSSHSTHNYIVLWIIIDIQLQLSSSSMRVKIEKIDQSLENI